MKKRGFIIGAIACACLIGPKIVGGMVKTEYDNILTRFAEHPSIEIVERSFINQWFSGESIAKIKFKNMPAEFNQYTLLVNEKLSYGPVIINSRGLDFALANSNTEFTFLADPQNTAETQPDENKAQIDKFVKILNEKLTITSSISYAMNYTSHYKMDETIYNEEAVQITIAKLDSEFTLKDEKQVTGYINWDGGSFSDMETVVNVKPVKITFDQEVVAGDVYTGNALMSGGMAAVVSNINASNTAGIELFNIDNLSFDINSSINEGLMNIDVKYGAEKFKNDEHELTNAIIDVALNNLDSKLLFEINQEFSQYQGDPTTFPMQKFIDKASLLLVNNPEFIIKDLSFDTTVGSVKSDMNVVVNHTLYNKANPMSIIGALTANAKGKVPEMLLHQLGLAGMVNMYVEQGLIIRDEEQLTFDAQFDQGKLTVNGQVIPL